MSQYFQSLRELKDGVNGWDEFARRPAFLNPVREWRKVIQRYESAFGKGSVRVVDYDGAQATMDITDAMLIAGGLPQLGVPMKSRAERSHVGIGQGQGQSSEAGAAQVQVPISVASRQLWHELTQYAIERGRCAASKPEGAFALGNVLPVPTESVEFEQIVTNATVCHDLESAGFSDVPAVHLSTDRAVQRWLLDNGMLLRHNDEETAAAFQKSRRVCELDPRKLRARRADQSDAAFQGFLQRQLKGLKAQGKCRAV